MNCMEIIKSTIKDINLAKQGENNINWAIKDMPVLEQIKKRFENALRFGILISYTIEGLFQDKTTLSEIIIANS